MADGYVNIYKDNPTAGGTDGTAVSTGGTYTAPIRCSLDAAVGESKIVTLAIRTESGYAADNVSITASGTNSRWTLSKTNDTPWAGASTITFDSISAANSLFYAKATSSSLESPQAEHSIKFQFAGKVKLVTS